MELSYTEVWLIFFEETSMTNVLEKPISEYFRPYPAYEDVFYDDIENHKKHFLPICSVNLKFLFPEHDEWVHFISAKEQNLGLANSDYFTRYTQGAMYSFDIINGKYKFEADWRYFRVNNRENAREQLPVIDKFITNMNENRDFIASQEWITTKGFNKQLTASLNELWQAYSQLEWAEKQDKNTQMYYARIDRERFRHTDKFFDELENEYELATQSYELSKKFYQKYGHIYPNGIRYFKGDFSDLNTKFYILQQQYPDFILKLPEYFGFITDIKALSKEVKKFCPNGFPTSSGLLTPIHYNIWEHPMRKRKQFEYIGCITEYYFRYAGATVLNAFHDHEAKKATMLLDFD